MKTVCKTVIAAALTLMGLTMGACSPAPSPSAKEQNLPADKSPVPTAEQTDKAAPSAPARNEQAPAVPQVNHLQPHNQDPDDDLLKPTPEE